MRCPVLLFGVGLFALLAAWPATARADADDAAEVAGVGTVIVLAGADLSFFGYAIASAARNEAPPGRVSLAQSLFTGPQVIGFNVGTAMVATERDGAEILAPLAPFGMVVNTVFVHGVWSSARPDHDQREVFAAASVIGVNVGWTSALLGYAADPRMDMEALGPALIATSAASLGTAIPFAVVRRGFRTGWIANAAWSGALFTFGALGTFGALTPAPERERIPPGHESASPVIHELGFGPVAISPIRADDPAAAFGLRGRW